MTGRGFSPEWAEGHRVDVSALRRADVVGIGHARREVDALALRLREPERAARLGLEPPRGVLFHGGPGLGKTLLARYLAASLGPGVPFYEVSSDELSPERIRGLVRYLAEEHPVSVAYLDEIDGFGLDRDSDAHDPDTRLLLTAALGALDGLRETPGPVVVASSNRGPSSLDPALVRSGRLSVRVRFEAPDEAERLALFRLFARGIPASGRVDWRHAARVTGGRTPADIQALVQDAGALALAAGRDAIGRADLAEAVRRGGSVEPEPARAAELAARIAAHEAGHVAVAEALRPGWVRAVRIGAREGATSLGDERVTLAQAPDDEVRDRLVVAFGGIAAERLLLGEPSQGGRADVERATSMALDRVRAGVDEHGVLPDLDSLRGYAPDALEADVADAVRCALERSRALAEEVVESNAAAVGRFAGALRRRGELTGRALARAVADAGFALVPERGDGYPGEDAGGATREAAS